MITVPTILVSLLALASVQLCGQIIYYRFFHPLRHYPGPFLASVTSLWSAWHLFWGTETLECWKAVQKYGPIVRVTPTMVLFSESSIIPTIYHRRSTKGRWFISEFFQKPGTPLIRDPFQHAAHRRLVASTYAMSNIQRMEPLVTSHIEQWIAKLDTDFAAKEKPVDFSKWTAFFSYDAVTDLGFRSPVGFVESGKDDHGLIKGFQLGMLLMGSTARINGLLPGIANSWVGKYLKVGAGNELFFRNSAHHAGQVLEDRHKALAEGRTIKPQKGESSYDFLQAFMDTRTPDGELLDTDAIKSELFVIFGAGADGFSSTCSSLVMEILSHPQVYERVIEEIRAAVEAGHLSQPIPTHNEVAKFLPYYAACVSEALRLHPLSSIHLPREITPLDPEMIVSGRKIPLGVEVACNPWICHRDKAVYGDDAEVFRPDRWLEDPERAKIFEKYNLAWGAGSRVCLGKHIAMVMIYKAPVALLMKFDMSLCRETRQTPKARRLFHGPVLLWRDLWINLTKRTPWTSLSGAPK
ncbi:putative P450 monooxygenase [Aspergillus undulatus]|uniref:putative P450 monooxygenase n=1 Tax=Aspergillus undulatus TaxID=1810928 RepID=UPI003CCDEE3D